MIKKVLYTTLVAGFMMADTLPVLVEKAISNKIVEASQKNVEASKLDYKSLKKSYLPSLYLNSNYYDTSNETALQANSSFDSSLVLNYNLYDGGKKQNRYEALESRIKSQNYNLENLKNQISLDVTTLYFNYLSLFEAQKAKLQEISQLQEQYEKEQKLFETETVAIDRVEKIRSRLESQTVALQEIKLNKETILHTLEYLIGEEVSIEEGSFIHELHNKQSDLRADIKALEFDLKELKSDAKAKKSSLYPKVDLTNTYAYYDNSFENEAYETNVDTQNTVGVNLTWKLYDFDATNKEYEANMKRYLALKSQYEYEKHKMSVDLKLAYKGYNISLLKIKAAKESLLSANSTFRVIAKKYENNLVDNVAYLEALSEKYNAISVLKSSEFELEIKRAEIIYHSGKDIVAYVK